MTCWRKKNIINFEFQQLDTKVDYFLFIYQKTLDTARESENISFCHIKEVSMPYLCKALFENTNNRLALSNLFQGFFQVFLPKRCILIKPFPRAPQFSNDFHSLHSHLNQGPRASFLSKFQMQGLIKLAEPFMRIRKT